LTAREIVDQVMAIEEEFGGRRVSNVVFMGMGEPMLNVPNVVKATELLNKEIGIGMRHISISTVGVFGALEKLARYEMQCVLAVSLHAPNQKIREEIIPSARAYSFDDILNDCVAYFNATGRRVTFEYTLLAGVNDQKEHAKELASVLFKKNLASHVNLIPYNPVDDSDFKRPTKQAIDHFRRILEENNVPTSVRQTRGLEAAAACGQLRNMYQKEALVA
jgi:23S rRNA (adenine2503-C2)-methyltransferase